MDSELLATCEAQSRRMDEQIKVSMDNVMVILKVEYGAHIRTYKDGSAKGGDALLGVRGIEFGWGKKSVIEGGPRFLTLIEMEISMRNLC